MSGFRVRFVVLVLTATVFGVWFAWCRLSADPSPRESAIEESKRKVALAPTVQNSDRSPTKPTTPAAPAKPRDTTPAAQSDDWNSEVAPEGRPGGDCSSRSDVIHDVRICLKRLGVSFKYESVIHPATCARLAEVYRQYRDRDTALEAKRGKMMLTIGRNMFLDGKAEVFFPDAVWRDAVATDANKDKSLRRLGYKPLSEAPLMGGAHEHQCWHWVNSEQERIAKHMPKSPLYPATHVVRIKFGTNPTLDQPMGMIIALQKERAILYCSILPPTCFSYQENR
ncbi:MAG: hypothetical protein H6837_15250 [Planctomycetes bacterium]|nr:hypothetical protein [Planctomycetota bacterium]